MKQIIEGTLCILIGGSVIYFTIRYPVKKRSVLLPNLSGILGGIFLIVIGILILIGNIPPC